MEKYEDMIVRLRPSTIERLLGIAEENGWFCEEHDLSLSEIIENLADRL